ncbi:MAG TPA: dATP/dGTP diphosphohydrolase domain-containing protein [Ktedonobacterales bacterium]|nr:dATP/dGTP diphosphohydrolase domain-containing protein [Ktedonobacterales bacterium]
MTERTWEDDFTVLLNPAIEALDDALRDGDRGGKHPPGSWRSGTAEEQMQHIAAHLYAYYHGDRSEDHLGHILCRAAIAIALRTPIPSADRLKPVPPSFL